MTEPKSNVPASIRQRLKNLSASQPVPFQEILQCYAIERFLCRLSRSDHAGKFVLKGAQMLVAWGSPRTRPTMDIDLLGHTDNDLANLEAIGRAVCNAPDHEPDGIAFDAETVKAIRIKEDADYEGVRVTFTARLGNARIPMQIDVGFNDIVTPAPEQVAYRLFPRCPHFCRDQHTAPCRHNVDATRPMALNRETRDRRSERH